MLSECDALPHEKSNALSLMPSEGKSTLCLIRAEEQADVPKRLATTLGGISLALSELFVQTVRPASPFWARVFEVETDLGSWVGPSPSWDRDGRTLVDMYPSMDALKLVLTETALFFRDYGALLAMEVDGDSYGMIFHHHAQRLAGFKNIARIVMPELGEVYRILTVLRSPVNMMLSRVSPSLDRPGTPWDE